MKTNNINKNKDIYKDIKTFCNLILDGVINGHIKMRTPYGDKQLMASEYFPRELIRNIITGLHDKDFRDKLIKTAKRFCIDIRVQNKKIKDKSVLYFTFRPLLSIYDR